MSTGRPDSPGLNRRQFLTVTCGATLALLLDRGIAAASDKGHAETTCPKDGQAAKRVLIAYASRCGSTASVAEAMASALCATGASVDLRMVDHVKDLSPYQAVMVGGAIRAGKWLPEAAAFVKNNQEALGRMPLAYFVVCLTMKEDTPDNRAKVLAYLDPVRNSAPGLTPAAVGLFPGAVDFSKLSFMHKTILEAKGVVEGDYRNLPAAHAWASGLGPAFAADATKG